VPVAGSAYTFSYATLGEFVAWLIGWDLILEFTLGAATVAKGWSGYLVSVFEIGGIKLPTSLYASPESGVSHDWIALIVVALVTTILVEAARPPAGVQGTRLPCGAYPGRPLMPLPHGLSDPRYLGEVLCLDGDRARDLLRLQQEP
jgi:hypothetical protein